MAKKTISRKKATRSSKTPRKPSTRFRLAATNLADHFTFEPPPKGFDLLRASMEDLHSYGLPHRPDPKTMPKASRLWYHVMKRIKRFVTPELIVRRDLVHGPERNLRPLADPSANLFGGSGWSGLVVTDAPPYTQVWGTWMVPAVQVPPNQSGDFFSSTWVGLGGFGNATLLQAGTEQDASLGYNLINGFSWSYFAWFEWFPAPSVQLGQSSAQFPGGLPAFTISPGQTVAVSVGVFGDGSGRGLFSMANLETGLAITPIVVPIPTVDFNGNTIVPALTGPNLSSAEWIVERPSTTVSSVLTLLELADYGEVNFTNAGATAAGPGSSSTVLKTETIAAAADTLATSVTMLADDGVTALSDETVTPALHFTFQQTAAGQ
jgi:hypothetical protein